MKSAIVEPLFEDYNHSPTCLSALTAAAQMPPPGPARYPADLQ